MISTSRAKRNIFIGIVILICLFLVIIFAARSWIRTSLIPEYATSVYMPKINRSFDKRVTPINDNLIRYGFHFTQTATDFEGCGDPEYQGLGENIGCLKNRTSNKLRPSNQLRASWHDTADMLEKKILAAGWTKDNLHQPIVSLLDFDDPNDTSQHDVSYRYNDGGIQCGLRIVNSPSSHEIFAVEGCSHEVQIFDGY